MKISSAAKPPHPKTSECKIDPIPGIEGSGFDSNDHEFEDGEGEGAEGEGAGEGKGEGGEGEGAAGEGGEDDTDTVDAALSPEQQAILEEGLQVALLQCRMLSEAFQSDANERWTQSFSKNAKRLNRLALALKNSTEAAINLQKLHNMKAHQRAANQRGEYYKARAALKLQLAKNVKAQRKRK